MRPGAPGGMHGPAGAFFARHAALPSPGPDPGLLRLFAGLAAVAPAAARAELIVFEDGRVVKAAAYQLFSEELEIELPGGGSYRVDLARVDRIVDDEVIVDVVLGRARESRASTGDFDLSYRADRKPLFSIALRRDHRAGGQGLRHRRLVRLGPDPRRVQLRSRAPCPARAPGA